MTKTNLALRGALLAAAALLTATPAQSAPRPVTTGNWLYLTVTRGDVPSSGTGGTGGTLLMCSPPRGHGRVVLACAQLAAVEGDITRIPPKNTKCPMIYAPVTASAHGKWNGRQIDYHHTFANRCVLEARTGEVFALTDRAARGGKH